MHRYARGLLERLLEFAKVDGELPDALLVLFEACCGLLPRALELSGRVVLLSNGCLELLVERELLLLQQVELLLLLGLGEQQRLVLVALQVRELLHEVRALLLELLDDVLALAGGRLPEAFELRRRLLCNAVLFVKG